MIVNALTDCQACDQTIIGHPRCAACWIFAGEGHYDTILAGGLCESCRVRDNLVLPDEGLTRRRERRAEALRIFETGGMGAVRARFRLTKDRARKWLAQAQRERAAA